MKEKTQEFRLIDEMKALVHKCNKATYFTARLGYAGDRERVRANKARIRGCDIFEVRVLESPWQDRDDLPDNPGGYWMMACGSTVEFPTLRNPRQRP